MKKIHLIGLFLLIGLIAVYFLFFWGIKGECDFDSIRQLKYSPDGKKLAIDGGHSTCILNLENNTYKHLLEYGGVDDMKWISDRELITLQYEGYACDNKTYCLKFWNAENGELLKTKKLNVSHLNRTYPITDFSATISTDGSHLAVIYNPCSPHECYRLGIYDIQNQTSINEIPIPYRLGLSYHQSRKYLIAGEFDSYVSLLVYSLPNYELIYEFNKSFGTSTWSSDGNTFVYYADYGERILFYSINETNKKFSFSQIKSIAFDIKHDLKQRLSSTLIKKMSLSEDNKYLVLGISDAPGYCFPYSNEVCVVAHIVVFNTETGSKIFEDVGGKIRNNEVYFYWSADSKKLKYWFTGESKKEIDVNSLNN